MNEKRWMILAAAACLWLSACDRPKSASTTAGPEAGPAPQTQPSDSEQLASDASSADSETRPATAPTTRPAVTTFLVNEGGELRSYDFPRARLHVAKDDKKLVVYSDDPKTAINSDYSGNSFLLEFPLEGVDDPQKLNGVQLQYKAISSEIADTASGIFLQGQRVHIQPFDAILAIQGDGPVVQIIVQGQFQKFDSSTPTRLPITVAVRGEFTAIVNGGK